MKHEIAINWYQELITDLKKLAFEGIVKTKWQIGKRIMEDELKFDKPEYGSHRIENIAKDVQGSVADIYLCIQFAKKYPELSTAVENLSWREVRKSLPEKKRVKPETPPLPEGKYNIIYADPPWSYVAGGYKNQEQHYPGMTIEEIKNLPIADIAADNCILFLWVTFPIIDRAFEVINSWGFQYSTVGFTWVKQNKTGKGYFFGLGFWTRANAELCLIATKGSIERKDASISQLIVTPIEEHSKKPAVVRDKIIQLVGDLPRIELFSRQAVKGWDKWGKQI